MIEVEVFPRMNLIKPSWGSAHLGERKTQAGPQSSQSSGGTGSAWQDVCATFWTKKNSKAIFNYAKNLLSKITSKNKFLHRQKFIS
jgi:hypothetical protein